MVHYLERPGRVQILGALTLLMGVMLVARCRAPEPEISAKRIVAMEYPGFARMAQLQGIVILEARISPQGTAENISVVSGKWPLANPAKETLSKWRFAGCTSTGRRCTTKFIFSFVLSGTCTPGSDCPTEFEVDLPNKVLVKCEVFDSLISATERPMPTTS